MKERIVIIFIAVTLGLLATTIGFFVYENAKPNRKIEEVTKKAEEPVSNKKSILLTITAPTDESVTSKRSVEVKGKTDPQNTVIISTNQEDVVAVPTNLGEFNATVSIDTGVNKLIIESVTPQGESTKEERTVSFSAEE